MHLWATRTSAAAILVVGIVIGGVIGATIPRLQTNSHRQTSPPDEAPALDHLQPDILSMRQMAAAQDVKGLAAILSDGQFESRLVAANFLAKLAPLPALETVSMQAGGELRADRQGGNLRLYSTGHSDWLELADSMITVHIGSAQQRATLVRLTHTKEDDRLQQMRSKMNLGHFRKERADLEKQLATTDSIPGDVSQLRRRIEVCSRILDLMDGAIYISPAGGGLHLQDRTHGRETDLFPSDSGVRAEWHGVTVDANSITLRNGLGPVRTGGPIAPPHDWRSRFNQVYSLADGEVLRWIRPPFIPERQYYIQETSEHSESSPGNCPQWAFLSFRWDGTLRHTSCGIHELMLGGILRDLGNELGLRWYETSGPKELLQLRLGGDWMIRTGTSIEQRFSAFESILERELERRIRFVRKSVEREVIVVRGRYEKRPLEGHETTEPIYLFVEMALDQSRIVGPSVQASVAQLLDRVGGRFNRPVILETEGLDQVSVAYQECISYFLATRNRSEPDDRFPMQSGENLDPVLANLTRQTSLEFARETRPFDTWFVTEIEGSKDANTIKSIRPQE